MSKELVIASNRHETKVAILEDDQLVEVYFQRANEYSLAGSIHKGRVTRVLPGMQSAFVDLGLERDTFLYVSDFFEEHEDLDTGDDKPEKPARNGRPERQERPERPFRGNESRQQQQTGEQRGSEVLPASEAAVFAEGAASAAPLGEPSGPSAASQERGEGDRRGRRSRRRRSRGRGFPESKYASPGSTETSSDAAETSDAVESSDEQEEPASSDVLILPGESLAKYRRARSEGARHVDARSKDIAHSAPSADEAEPSTQEFRNGLEEEELPELFETKIEEKVEALLRLEETPALTSTQAIGKASLESAELIEDVAEETAEEEPAAEEAAESAVSEVDELRSEFEESIREFADTKVSETSDVPADETAEATEPGEDVTASAEPEGEGTSAPESEEKEPAQTAAVREQGGRYMHRMSRRMRRRRGGNRFPSQGQAAGEGGTAAAAAPAAEPVVAQPEAKPEGRAERHTEEHATSRPERVLPSIADLLKAGQEIIVQIAKEPLGQKGARITSHIALPGRYVVFMPSVDHVGVSRKIASDEERHRLKKIMQAHRVGTTGGFICRTAGEGHTEEEIAADMSFLYNLWLDIRQKAEKRPAPSLLHHDLDVVQRILRDQVTDEFKAVWVDNEEMYESVLRFTQRFQPSLVGKIKLYTRSTPIFDAFNITAELEKALRPKVWLKSGGYIVINQTEALVAIDVNTGKFVGKSNKLEDTIVKTNTEAVKEIVRQIRLRDLGGIIVVDFIDMDERKNRQKVMQALEEAMRSDKAPYKVLQFNDFGLVAITRKRVKQSLERALCAPCPYCEGAGYVKSVQTIISEILVEAQKIAKAIEGKDVVLRVHSDVAKVLKSNTNRYLEELEDVLGLPVLVIGDNGLHHEKFDLA